jgi:hypothetical protein
MKRGIRWAIALSILAASVAGCATGDAGIGLGPAWAGQWQQLLTSEAVGGWSLTPAFADEPRWPLRNGVFEGTNSWVGYERVYGDFVLECEFLFDGSSQGGIVIRGDRRAETPWSSGYELDIDWAPGHRQGHVHFPVLPKPYAGEIRFDVGKWHHVRIEARGSKVVVTLDGKEQIRFTNAQFGKGHVCLEGEPGGVKYRSLRVLPLGGGR